MHFFFLRVLVDLLKLDVSPAAIFNVLQSMALQGSKPTSLSKKNSQNKSGLTTQASSKKKPPVAAKPKKIRVENQEVAFWHVQASLYTKITFCKRSLFTMMSNIVNNFLYNICLEKCIEETNLWFKITKWEHCHKYRISLQLLKIIFIE